MGQYNKIITKWMWMTDYCKKMQWNPHDAYFWNKAEEEYCKFLSRNT